MPITAVLLLNTAKPDCFFFDANIVNHEELQIIRVINIVAKIVNIGNLVISLNIEKAQGG